MQPKICLQCGAPIHGSKCEYCGTEYAFNTENHIEATIYGHKVKGYVGDVNVERVVYGAGRNPDGSINKGIIKKFVKFYVIGELDDE